MTHEQWNNAMNHLDRDLIEDHIAQQEQYLGGNRRNRLWLSIGAVAACLALLAGTFFLTPRPGNPATEPTTLSPSSPTTPPPSNDPTPSVESPSIPPLKFDSFTQLSGSNLEFVKGSSTAVTNGGQAETCPPEFNFIPYDFTAVVRVVENFPDSYYLLNVDSTYKPTAYRLVRMEVIQPLHGEDLPQEFLYLLPEHLYVDMSSYDCLLVAMVQQGTAGYVLRNHTQNRMDACPLPLFADRQKQPELGNIIAFTEGIFDETLWQTESWRYGYQFGEYYLDNPKYSNLVVHRGITLEETISNINQRLETYQGSVPSLVTLDFDSQAAQDAIAYVKPFENGVFNQILSVWNTGGRLSFCRFINGCQTEEIITIDLVTEEVTYSQVRYTPEDMENLQNIALYLSEQAAAYANDFPTPPHIDPAGRNLLCLSLYAWYAKVGGKLYGVVKTAWRYSEQDDWFTQFYDDQYVLFDMTEGRGKEISRDDLLTLLGNRNVYTGTYGEAHPMPME